MAARRRRRLTQAQREILGILRDQGPRALATSEVAETSGFNYDLTLYSLRRLVALGLASRHQGHEEPVTPQAHGGGLRPVPRALWAAMPQELVQEAERAALAARLHRQACDLDRRRADLERELQAALRHPSPG